MTVALAASRLVDAVIGVSSTIIVLAMTHSPGWVAAVMLARMVPLALLGLLAVAAVRMLSQRAALVVSASTRAVAALAVVAAAHSAPGWVVSAVVVAGLGSAAFKPAAGRLITTHTAEAGLAQASARVARIDYGSVLVAPVLCGLLLLITTVDGTLIVAAVLAAGLAAGVTLVRPDHFPRSSRTRALRQVGAAAHLIMSVRDARTYLGIRTFARIALGIVSVVITLVPARAHAADTNIAFLQAALGVGALLVAFAPGRLPDRTGTPAILVATVVLVGGLAVLGQARPVIVAGAALAALGAADLALNLACGGSVQRVVPSVAGAAGSGVADSLTALGMLAGIVVAPGLIHGIGLNGACFTAGAIVALSVLVGLPRLRRADAAARVRDDQTATITPALRACPALADLPSTGLRVLADATTPLRLRRGALAVAEGAPSDAVFIVRSGTLSVRVTGEDARRTGRMVTLGVGDLFGEIGVLRRRPRTASVLATSDVELLRVPAQSFVDVVSSELGASTAVYTGLTERLSRSHSPPHTLD